MSPTRGGGSGIRSNEARPSRCAQNILTRACGVGSPRTPPPPDSFKSHVEDIITQLLLDFSQRKLLKEGREARYQAHHPKGHVLRPVVLS